MSKAKKPSLSDKYFSEDEYVFACEEHDKILKLFEDSKVTAEDLIKKLEEVKQKNLKKISVQLYFNIHIFSIYEYLFSLSENEKLIIKKEIEDIIEKNKVAALRFIKYSDYLLNLYNYSFCSYYSKINENDTLERALFHLAQITEDSLEKKTLELKLLSSSDKEKFYQQGINFLKSEGIYLPSQILGEIRKESEMEQIKNSKYEILYNLLLLSFHQNIHIDKMIWLVKEAPNYTVDNLDIVMIEQRYAIYSGNAEKIEEIQNLLLKPENQVLSKQADDKCFKYYIILISIFSYFGNKTAEKNATDEIKKIFNISDSVINDAKIILTPLDMRTYTEVMDSKINIKKGKKPHSKLSGKQDLSIEFNINFIDRIELYRKNREIFSISLKKKFLYFSDLIALYVLNTSLDKTVFPDLDTEIKILYKEIENSKCDHIIYSLRYTMSTYYILLFNKSNCLNNEFLNNAISLLSENCKVHQNQNLSYKELLNLKLLIECLQVDSKRESLEKARFYTKELIKSDNKNPKLYYDMAIIFHKLRDYNSRNHYINKAAELDSYYEEKAKFNFQNYQEIVEEKTNIVDEKSEYKKEQESRLQIWQAKVKAKLTSKILNKITKVMNSTEYSSEEQIFHWTLPSGKIITSKDKNLISIATSVCKDAYYAYIDSTSIDEAEYIKYSTLLRENCRIARDHGQAGIKFLPWKDKVKLAELKNPKTDDRLIGELYKSYDADLPKKKIIVFSKSISHAHK